jgi:hypothetical protein
MSTLITYERIHRLGRQDSRRLHTAMAACMETFGFAADPTESFFKLDLRADDDPALNAAYEEIARDYGRHAKKLQGTNVTDMRELRTFFWQIPQGSLDAAFERVATLRARGGLVQSRTGLKLIWKFRFRDPDTRELLPGQDALPRLDNFPGGRGDSSCVVLNLGDPSSVWLWFLLPFAEPDAAFLAYVGRLQAALPAQLSSRGWRRWALARSGEWRAKRLSVDVGAA